MAQLTRKRPSSVGSTFSKLIRQVVAALLGVLLMLYVWPSILPG